LSFGPVKVAPRFVEVEKCATYIGGLIYLDGRLEVRPCILVVELERMSRRVRPLVNVVVESMCYCMFQPQSPCAALGDIV
jgi:hypothetical protein